MKDSMSTNDVERFLALRADLSKAIKTSLDQNKYYKSHEGRLILHFPAYFGKRYIIALDCNSIYPAQHYYWIGETFNEAFDKVEKDIHTWVHKKYIELMLNGIRPQEIKKGIQ